MVVVAVVVVRQSDDDAFSRIEAQEVYRRLEAMSSRIGSVAENMAVMAERNRSIESKLDDLEKETFGLSRLANRGMGVMLALALIGGALGGFWDKLLKLWSH